MKIKGGGNIMVIKKNVSSTVKSNEAVNSDLNYSGSGCCCCCCCC